MNWVRAKESPEQLCQRIQDCQGYIIMAFRDGPKPIPSVGDVYKATLMRHESKTAFVRIVDYATFSDYKYQNKKYRNSFVVDDALAYFKVIAE